MAKSLVVVEASQGGIGVSIYPPDSTNVLTIDYDAIYDSDDWEVTKAEVRRLESKENQALIHAIPEQELRESILGMLKEQRELVDEWEQEVREEEYERQKAHGIDP